MDLLNSDLSGELRWGEKKQHGLFLFPFNLSVSYFLCCVGNGGGGAGSRLAKISAWVPGRLKIQVISCDSKLQLQTAALARFCFFR